jgi:hypothetical protein
MAGEQDADRGAGHEDEQGDDPFANLSLDDDFVNAAEVREESAEDRMARLHRIDQEHRELQAERERERHHAARSNRRRSELGGLAGSTWRVGNPPPGWRRPTSLGGSRR